MTPSNTPRPQTTGPANDTDSEFKPSMADAAASTRAHMRAHARAPQNRVKRKAVGYAFRTIDTMAVLLFVAAGLYSPDSASLAALNGGDMIPAMAFGVLSLWLLSVFGLYRVDPRTVSALRVARAFIAAGFAGTVTTAATLYLAPASVEFVAGFAAVSVLALSLLHIVYAGLVSYWARAGRLASNIVLVGATANARKIIAANAGSRAVNLVGVFDDRRARSPSQLAGIPYLGNTQDLFKWSLLPEIDTIVLTVSPKAEDRVQHLLGKLRALPHSICLLLDIEGFDPKATSLEDIVGVQAARMSGDEDRLGHLMLKRAQDLVFGGLAFVAALPFMALIAVLVKLDSRGPVLFRQEREGFNGRMIEVLKFRTMRHDPSPAPGKPVRQVVFNDPRVTRIGNLLRTTSLDELPQLWNVLTGEMSLVGPRPHAPSMKTGGTKTSNLVSEYAHRHRVKPGITGWAQVNGSRGPLHTPEAARERIRWDLEYVARSNVWFDFWIMLRTLPALLGDKINIR